MSKKYILSHSAKTRRLTWRYTLLIGALLLLLAIFQVSLFSRFCILGATPDLMIVAVLCLAFFGGRYMGAVVGIAGGFLIDALGSTGVVLLPLCYFLLGYLVGHFASRSTQNRYVTYLAYLGIVLLYRAAITFVYVLITYESLQFGALLTQILLPEMLNTALAGLALYIPLRLFSAWVGKYHT